MTEQFTNMSTNVTRASDNLKHTSPGAAALAGKVFRRLRRYYRQWFKNRNYVFMNSGPFEPVINPPCEFARFDEFDDIPDLVKETIEFNEGLKSLEMHRLEMEQAAVMWMGFINGRLAGLKLTRCGRYFKKWFVELQDNDIVIFRARTFPEYRGREVSPAITLHAMYSLLREGDRAFSDCRTYNKPIIRSIEKSGFTRIATMKPITREDALGEGR